VVLQAASGSFDSGAASLREASPPLRMTEGLGYLISTAEVLVVRIPAGAAPPVHCLQWTLEVATYLGSGSFMLASAYPITAMAAAFSRNSLGTILSNVSAAVWW
jgi:hypothetical protein